MEEADASEFDGCTIFEFCNDPLARWPLRLDISRGEGYLWETFLDTTMPMVETGEACLNSAVEEQ